jgi:hypothetical protein
MNKRNIAPAIIVILVIACVLLSYYYIQKSKNTIVQNEVDTGIEVDFYSDEIQKIAPFTGDTNYSMLAYLYKLDSDGLNNILSNGKFNNDFILKMAFSKVKHDDFSDNSDFFSGELYLDIAVFDKYVKDIFGDINYEKKDFNYLDLKINTNYERPYLGNLFSASFENNEMKVFETLFSDADVSSVEWMPPKVIKYKDRIEIAIKPYLLICSDFNQIEYEGDIAYVRYNYNTKKLEGKISDTRYPASASSEEDLRALRTLSQEDSEKLDTFIFVYKLDNGTNGYHLSEIKLESVINHDSANNTPVVDSNSDSTKRKLESYVDVSKTEYLTLNNTEVYDLIPMNAKDLTYYYLGKIMLNGEELEVTYYKDGLREELIFFKDKDEIGSLYVGEINGPNFACDEEYEETHKDLPGDRVGTISIYKSKYLVILNDNEVSSLTSFDILDSNFQVIDTFRTDSCYWDDFVSEELLVKITDDEFTYSDNMYIDGKDDYTRVVYRIDENEGVFTSTIIKVDPENTEGPAGQS